MVVMQNTHKAHTLCENPFWKIPFEKIQFGKNQFGKNTDRILLYLGFWQLLEGSFVAQ